MAQSGFDRLALAAVLFVDDDFGAGIARALGCFVGGAIIDDENIIELLASSANNVGDMFLLVVSGNDRRDFRVH